MEENQIITLFSNMLFDEQIRVHKEINSIMTRIKIEKFINNIETRFKVNIFGENIVSLDYVHRPYKLFLFVINDKQFAKSIKLGINNIDSFHVSNFAYIDNIYINSFSALTFNCDKCFLRGYDSDIDKYFERVECFECENKFVNVIFENNHEDILEMINI